jgi:hypothetical protein
MKVRSTGCVLTGDQLAVSGAPAAAANVTGNDADCLSPLPHKSVQADEMSAANLAVNPPHVATIQAGADDIGFSNCLEYDLTLHVLGSKCVINGKLSSNVSNALVSAKQALIQEVQQLQSVGTKYIELVNYYQPIPTPQEIALLHISSSNLVCYALFTQAKSTYTDAKLILTSLNDMIAQVAAATGVGVVNIAGLFKNRGMCTTNPVVFAGDNATYTFDWRTAHPNQKGQAMIAKQVESALNGI